MDFHFFLQMFSIIFIGEEMVIFLVYFENE